MSTQQKITLAVIFSTVALLVGYDIWAAFYPEATESAVILNISHRYLIIPFSIGILMGHFFFSQASEAKWHDERTRALKGLPMRDRALWKYGFSKPSEPVLKFTDKGHL